MGAVTPGETLGTLYTSGVGTNKTKQHASLIDSMLSHVLYLAGGNPSLEFTVRGRLLESRIPPSTLKWVPMAPHAHACPSPPACCTTASRPPPMPSSSLPIPLPLGNGLTHPRGPSMPSFTHQDTDGETSFYSRALSSNPSSLDAFRSALPDPLQ